MVLFLRSCIGKKNTGPEQENKVCLVCRNSKSRSATTMILRLTTTRFELPNDCPTIEPYYTFVVMVCDKFDEQSAERSLSPVNNVYWPRKPSSDHQGTQSHSKNHVHFYSDFHRIKVDMLKMELRSVVRWCHRLKSNNPCRNSNELPLFNQSEVGRCSGRPLLFSQCRFLINY
jgi:hypothetical protein